MWSRSSLIWALEIAGYGNCLYMIAPATDGWVLSRFTQSCEYATKKRILYGDFVVTFADLTEQWRVISQEI